MKKEHKYGEGTWFAVPLANDGFAIGVIARGNHRTALICYFFGPRRTEVPKLEHVENLTPEQADCTWQVSGLELRRGKWPILGRSELFHRENWPMPVFVHKGLDLELDGEKFPGRTELRYYDDDDPTMYVRRKVVKGKAAVEALDNLPQDCLRGSGAVESALDDML